MRPRRFIDGIRNGEWRIEEITRRTPIAPGPTTGRLGKIVSVTYGLHAMHVLDALGNPVRRDILHRLRGGPLAVGDIAAAFPISRPAISRHLRVLEDAGLGQVRADGSRNLYSIRMAGFATVRDYVDDFWDSALARLEALSQT